MLEQFKVFSVFCEVVKNCHSQFCRWGKKGNVATCLWGIKKAIWLPQENLWQNSYLNPGFLMGWPVDCSSSPAVGKVILKLQIYLLVPQNSFPSATSPRALYSGASLRYLNFSLQLCRHLPPLLSFYPVLAGIWPRASQPAFQCWEEERTDH